MASIDSKLVYTAAENGNINELRRLLDTNRYSITDIKIAANTRDSDLTPLGIAVNNKHLECVEFLVNKCLADVNGVDILDQKIYISPLWCAAKNGNWSIVEFLLRRGADVNVNNHDGETPLIIACSVNDFKIVKYLIEQYNANVEIVNDNGYTCLMSASRAGFIKMVKYLVECGGANVNKMNKNGFTALHCAAAESSLEIVKYLLNRGATLEIVDSFGNTPFSNAILSGFDVVSSYLMSLVSAKARIEGIELLGTIKVEMDAYLEAILLWKFALMERKKIGLDKVVESNHFLITEFNSEKELDEMLQNVASRTLLLPHYLFFQALLVRNRILGSRNNRNAIYAKKIAKKFENIGDLPNTIEPLMYCAKIWKSINCFSFACLNAYSRIVDILCKMIIKEEYFVVYLLEALTMSVNLIEKQILKLKEKEISHISIFFDDSLVIFTQILGMLTIPNITLILTNEQKSLVNQSVSRLVTQQTLSKGYTLLHLACLSSISNEAVKFPNANVIKLLKNVDANLIMAKDHAGNLPYDTFIENCSESNDFITSLLYVS